MPEISGPSLETVYPPKCDGICHLGPKALALVDGVLGRNCPGPQLFSGETLTLQEGPETRLGIVPTVEGDADKLACANPRLTGAIRTSIANQIDSLEIQVQTVEMER